MKRIVFALALLLVPALAVGSSLGRSAAAAPPGESARFFHSCGPSATGFAHCHAIVLLPDTGVGNGGGHGKPTPSPAPSATASPTASPTASATASPTGSATASPTASPTPVPTGRQGCASSFSATSPGGYGPGDLQSAYNLCTASASSGSTETVAIVDAYDDPNAASDLNVYRSHFGLGSCGSGCFTKVNQSGQQSNYPRANGGWAQEISLDLDMVSAICPNCKILLVEASSSSLTNLGTAVDTAANMGAVAISNSYGGNEFSSESSDDSYYNHPGIAITVSAGDSGYGAEYPATSPDVTAVGGTSLTSGGSNSWSETAWNGSGSGCSSYEAKPSWQSSLTSACPSNRAIADVSADADPNTGVAVYDSYSYQGLSGWLIFGGTSVASPIIASVYALADNTAAVLYGSYPYSHTSSLFDVTSGSNGNCGGTDLCTAGTGWDGPTGLGSPNGTGAF